MATDKPFRAVRGVMELAQDLAVVGQYGAVGDSQRRIRQLVVVLQGRFVDQPRRTLRDIGGELGVGPERARQIEAKALRMLRHPLRLQRFAELIESYPRLKEAVAV